MKIDKFDYKQKKDIIFDTIENLEINTNTFMKYYTRNYVDVRDDIIILMKNLKGQGVDLLDFLKKYEDEVFKDPDFTTKNGFMDSLLYWYDSNKGILGGVKLSDSDEIEFIIKYKYGYYNYDMGKKFILQSYNSLEEYYQATSENFLIGLISPDYDNLQLSNYFYSISKKQAKDIAEKCSIIEQYENGFTIYVHLKSLFFHLNYLKDYNVDYEEYVNAIKHDLKKIPYRIFDDMLEIFIGYKKHKITLQEFDEIKNELDSAYQDILIKTNANKYNL